MQIEQQESSICEAHPQPECALTSDGNAIVPASTSGHAVLQQPAKRPTRQWAAWTREEEESFFSALRQVGKNFEKITSRVKSKNKDQVRHYYYRLVRRMNKLLGPRLCLDAKNSKDTNAAMLRWWSLLEKYSCKASKLHLKPRRFKIFVEALEHQLLKDRKKSVRKRSQGENSSPSLCTLSSQCRPSAHENHTVKMVLVDSQNIQKLGPGKPSFKRSVSLGTTRGNNKGESTSVKQPRQRRKPGIISSTAYKKWEKAAIAGVSLVADAAEHVERTAADAAERVKITDNAGNHVNCAPANAAEHLNCIAVDIAQHAQPIAVDKDIGRDQTTTGQMGSDPGGGFHPPLPPLSQSHLMGGMQTCTKLKLQLFPIDDGTRRALEMDKHNPHLELTLSTRKKISSVLEHLNRKWGSSSVAHGQLMLFPYGIQRENLLSCTKWTQDSICSAADVYAIIGSPPVFRLWYGWFTNTNALVGLRCSPGDNSSVASNCSKKVGDMHRNEVLSAMRNPDAVPGSNDMRGQINGHAAETGDDNMKRTDGDQPRTASTAALSAGEWADSLTNISVGDLLMEVAQSEEGNGAETSGQKDHCAQQYSISCDSFDAAVAAHMSKYQDKVASQSTLSSHLSSSIWDAEETCDAFSFQKSTAADKEIPHENTSLGATEASGRTSPAGSDGFIEEPEVETAAKNPVLDDPIEEYLSDDQIIERNPTNNFSELTDIYWPESLGPLDLDIPAPSYRSEDLILSDSLSCLNRLIATSLDAFQNCSFFGTEKKEPDSTAVEARDNAPFGISS